MKWSWDLMHQWKAALVTLTVTSSDKHGTLPNSSPEIVDGTSDELDLKVNVNGTGQWKRWSVGSDTNGAYAKVENLDSDLDEVTISSASCIQLVTLPNIPNPNGSTDVQKPRDRTSIVYPTSDQTISRNCLAGSDIKFTQQPTVVLRRGGTTDDSREDGLPSRISWTLGRLSFRDSSTIARLLYDKWRSLFDQFDREGFGEIPWPEFMEALKSSAFIDTLEPGKINLLADMAQEYSHRSTAITFDHFVNVVSGKRSWSFKCAIHHRDREVRSESDFHLVPFGYKSPTRIKRMARLIADEFLADERDRKYYADHYRCLPPPLFIISITLIELGFFTYYTVWHGEVSSSGPLPIDSIFVYRPDKRQEVWRFFFYMVLHAGWVHLMFNLLVQLLVGLPLEMVHGSLRIGCVYMAGVLAGSLGTSVFDPDVYLVGASGGVYALLAAHLANVLLNYNNMEFGFVRLLGVFLIASVDVGFAIYDRYAVMPVHATDGSIPPVSYVAHLTGALAGLTIGLLVLKNFEQKLREQLMWWLALGIYGACTLFAILFNIFHPPSTYP